MGGAIPPSLHNKDGLEAQYGTRLLEIFMCASINLTVAIAKDMAG
jgi:hypothetical protein